MKCPKCGLFNEPGAENCDCGHALSGGRSRDKNALPQSLTREEKNWTIGLHLVGLLGLVNPWLGPCLVIGLWLLLKHEWTFLRESGRPAVNYWVDILIVQGLFLLWGYAYKYKVEDLISTWNAEIVSYSLLIATFVVTALQCIGFIGAIVAAFKANKGEVFDYFFRLPFFFRR